MVVDDRSLQFEQAWFGPRFVALFVDWLIFSVVWTIFSLSIMNSFVPPNFPAGAKSGAFPVEIFDMLSRFIWLMLAANALIFAYCVILETWIGATIGKLLVGIRTVDVSGPERRGIPLSKALLREFMKIAGFLPGLAFVMWGLSIASNVGDPASLQEMVGPMSALLAPLHFAVQILPLVWIAWIGISLVNNNRPIYDRMAGTTVVRA